jgi:hypothetical protein
MKKILSFIIIILLSGTACAQREFGFGITLGDPTGLTVKFWTAPDQAIDADVGADYFGAPRIDVDYLWHFYTFRSKIAALYAGMGGSVGFGHTRAILFYNDEDHHRFFYRSTDEIGFGVRALFGINVTPHKTPLELYAEIGVLVGILPGFGAAPDFAVGVRFYP